MIKWFQENSRTVRSYNKNIKMFMLANVFIQIGLGMFMVIYNFYIRELGYDESVNGQVISMMSLATALVLLPAGLLSDRIGRKKIMIIGAAITAATLFYRSFAVMGEALIYGAFATGFFVALIQVTGIPWLAENSTKKERVNLFSIHFSLMTGSQVVGSMLGGGLTDLFYIVFQFSALDSVRWALVIGSIFFTIGIMPLFMTKELPKSTRGKDLKIPRNVKVLKEETKRNIILIFLFAAAQLLIGFGSGLVIPYLNLYFADRFDASTAYVGFIISGGQAMTAVAILIGPWVVKQLGEVKAVFVLQMLSLPFLLLTAYTESLLLASVGFLFRQALMNAGNPIQASLVMDLVGDRFKGLANSINQMVFNIGWATMGPVSTGLVLIYGSYWGYAWIFTVTAGLYLISSAYFLITFTIIMKKRKNLDK
ncbi:MFS transporter [Jeotgalibacillus soli]|uniref:Major facilitator superfamily (MFS) profile domain-containing protein n=1 Tax=Jeotgalibacillus soli TaxID=889306 RepID=A0A0C2VLT7_9BACL|nr:MFS transporter [Jeotgalibacillus soli]KIL44968.1 hypothetical protein KP78_25120 [Jeotgalibacillus soli]